MIGKGRALLRDRAWAALAALGVFCAAGAACTTQRAAEPEGSATSGTASGIHVTDVSLGQAVGLDKKVRQATEVFSPDDTIYVSVVTEGTSPNTLLAARWKHQGRVLEETAQAIAPAGSATSEFHVSKPGGFEPGEYEVEILVEDKPVQQRRFAVK